MDVEHILQSSGHIWFMHQAIHSPFQPRSSSGTFSCARFERHPGVNYGG